MEAAGMTGRTRLPGGEQRKASQKRSRRAAVLPVRIEIPWAAGDRLKWRDRAGAFRHHVDDEYAEVGSIRDGVILTVQ
jgi:hypothetical protein